MELKLYDYQKYCVNKVLENESVGLFLDMGLGKTLITLTSINDLIYNRLEVSKVLVIAPKKVAEATWQDEIGKWSHLKYLRVSTVLGSQTQRVKALMTPADIYIINRDNVAWLVNHYKNDWPFDMVVCDEFTSFKSPKSNRFKALKSVRGKIKRLVGLTGTPAPNGLLDLWAQIYLIDGGQRLGKSFYGYKSNFFKSDYMGYNYTPREGTYDEVLKRISDVCISMKSEDYLELPDMVENDIKVKLTPKARKSYDEMAKKQVLMISDVEEIAAVNAAALSTKLLQLANGAIYDDDRQVKEIHDCKIEAFMELIEQLNGKSALVFYSYKHDLDRITKALSKTKLKYRVLTSPEDQRAWNNREIDILLTHPASSAYGLNLQHGGNHIIWFGLCWNLELYEQANKRLHRNGQTEKVIIHRLITEDTRDEDVIKALGLKTEVQEYVINSLKARVKSIKGVK